MEILIEATELEITEVKSEKEIDIGRIIEMNAGTIVVVRFENEIERTTDPRSNAEPGLPVERMVKGFPSDLPLPPVLLWLSKTAERRNSMPRCDRNLATSSRARPITMALPLPRR